MKLLICHQIQAIHMTKHIFWIASYPKSGNTLVRSILCSLFFSNNGIFTFDLLKKIVVFEELSRLAKCFNTRENNPFISDVRENNNVQLANGSTTSSRWLQFKIPIFPEYYEGTNFSNYFDRVNGISDLKSIRFIRMVLNGFQSQTTLRFATLDLIKTDWKRYTRNLNRENIFLI